MVRQALESMWSDRCTIYVRTGAMNATTKRTEFTESAIFTHQPCRLSFRNIATSNGTEFAEVKQVIKLILSPDIVIPAGSKIVVTRNGVSTTYQSSSEPAIYHNHQEIVLELFKGWA